MAALGSSDPGYHQLQESGPHACMAPRCLWSPYLHQEAEWITKRRSTSIIFRDISWNFVAITFSQIPWDGYDWNLVLWLQTAAKWDWEIPSIFSKATCPAKHWCPYYWSKVRNIIGDHCREKHNAQMIFCKIINWRIPALGSCLCLHFFH